ncbi:hypothetical protein AB6A40_005062 [Gnathostoma spinigerum]|uniref:Uncharacterized protein n=1 Tax=Gnathostoma spinigerum TaxID=75299 RepID=A0ABD6EED1_9BILA
MRLIRYSQFFKFFFVCICMSSSVRWKRDFMYVSDANLTDATCFQECNDAWSRSFSTSFNMSPSEFYEFPLHPVILDCNGFVKYCNISSQRVECYKERCGDDSADSVFSPSNFICHFKRRLFLDARECLEKTEPLTFLKCDHLCHDEALRKIAKKGRTFLGKVFSRNEIAKYQSEIDLLCTFQNCYKECEKEIVGESCSTIEAELTIQLITQYIYWHATDLYQWHMLSNTMETFPLSCQTLITTLIDEDPIIQIMAVSDPVNYSVMNTT